MNSVSLYTSHQAYLWVYRPLGPLAGLWPLSRLSGLQATLLVLHTWTPWPPCVLSALLALRSLLGLKAFWLPSCLPPCSSSLQASRPALHVACRCLSLGADGEERSEAWQKFVHDGPAGDAHVSASVPWDEGTHTTSPRRSHPRGTALCCSPGGKREERRERARPGLTPTGGLHRAQSLPPTPPGARPPPRPPPALLSEASPPPGPPPSPWARRDPRVAMATPPSPRPRGRLPGGTHGRRRPATR